MAADSSQRWDVILGAVAGRIGPTYTSCLRVAGGMFMATAVFYDYDQEALDREFNNRAKVTNLGHKVLQSDGSDCAKAQFSTRIDVPVTPTYIQKWKFKVRKY